MFGRLIETTNLVRELSPVAAQALYLALIAAQAKLTDARDAVPEDGRLAQLLHLLRQDVRAVQHAANDARLK